MNESVDFSKELVTFTFVSVNDNRKRRNYNASGFAASCAQLKNSLDRKKEDFHGGSLMETIEKGVTYPIVHRGSIQNYFQKETEDYGNNFIIEKGCYQEVEKVRVDLFGRALDDLKSHEDLPEHAPWSRFSVVLGFKQLPSMGKTEVLENHWKDWTGARYLYLHLPDEFGPVRITFYKRFTPEDFNLFLYLVVAECVRVLPGDVQPLSDFVQRMRADKMPFYLALYEDVGHRGIRHPEERGIHHPEEQDVRWSSRRILSSAGSTGPSSPVSSLSDELPVTPRLTSTPIYRSPVAAFHSRVTFLNF